MKSSHRLFRLLLPMLGLGLLLPASGQLQIDIQLDRNNYVVHEPVMAVVTVENRAGKDILLGGPAGTSWLMIDLHSSDGKVISSDAGEPATKPVMLKKGAKITREIDLMSFYPIEDPDAYLVTCNVYFPDLQRWLGASVKRLFRTVSAKPSFWERTVGVPQGHRDAGRYRRYKLFTNKSNALTPTGNMELQLLYLQVIDEESEENLTTHPLSQILTYRDPQATTDSSGNLHVLFMFGPQLFYHLTLDVDGAVVEKKIYSSGDNSIPTLMQSNDARVSVRGGRLFDPIVEAELARKRAKELKNLSDRPPINP
ncbi:MAG: hypothetical protein KA004_13350 [Verrucomicrobiales bacterium]|nr:hypothetical protein [Verrucomicrobiales bacterium]